MKVVIVDDEKKARNVIRNILVEITSDFSNIYEASNLLAGVEIITEEKPDLVLLDIEMPEYSGLELYKFIDEKDFNFQLVFITAYNQYAIEAFKLSALNYLLKPVSRVEFKATIIKALDNIKTSKSQLDLDVLKKVFEQLSFNKIALEVPGGIKFISYDEICYFKADGMYTSVHFQNRNNEIVCRPLKYFEEQLKDNHYFYRTHRSYIVNLRHLKELVKKDGFYIRLENDDYIPITKTKQQDFLSIIQQVYQK